MAGANDMGWERLSSRYEFLDLSLFHKIGHSDTDLYECSQKEMVAHFLMCSDYSAKQEILHNKI